MTASGPTEEEVFAFITQRIDTVPHLEALLLLWRTRPQSWSAANVASRLYISADAAGKLLQDLVRSDLIVVADDAAEEFCYKPLSETADTLVNHTDEVYRSQLVRVSTMIHSKGSAAVRDFARAFRFVKERP